MNTTPLPAGSLRATSLNAARRAAELSKVADGKQLDLLVVGGGVTGAGIALDAAARGLSVALAESEDLAYGTSRWSSGLVHGGERLLPQGEVAMARECAIERNVLMTRTAPHLVRTLPQLLPLHETVSRTSETFLSAEMRAGDALRRAVRTPTAILPPPHRVPAAEALALMPGVRPTGLRAGLLNFTGQLIDDARLVLALARTAAGFGARILTRVHVEAVNRTGADAVDRLTGESLRINARAVVNATGAWATDLDSDVRLRHFRGSHVLIDADAAGLAGTALITPVPEQPGRFLFLLPQPDGHAYLGATDETVTGPIPATTTAPESDVDFLLGGVEAALSTPLERKHVLGTFAGFHAIPADSTPSGIAARLSRLRPKPADSTRRPAVLTSPEGLVTVAGGQLTLYRRIAAEAVDAAIATANLQAGPSKTAAVPLVGAAGRDYLTRVDSDQRLIAKYGTEAGRVSALSELDSALGEHVTSGFPLTAAEVLWAVRHEGALDVSDVLDRRSRIGLDPRRREAARAEVEVLVDRALHGISG